MPDARSCLERLVEGSLKDIPWLVVERLPCRQSTSMLKEMADGDAPKVAPTTREKFRH